MKGYRVSNGKVVDSTNTDQAYWDAQLEAAGLGMNRGTTFPEADLLANEADRKNRKLKSKGGRPRKGGTKGPRPALTKNEIINATRTTVTPEAPGGIFQFGGFRHIGPSKQVGAGKGQKGGKKGPDERHFIEYVGNAYDLARLEESIINQEGARVHPSGYGPYR